MASRRMLLERRLMKHLAEKYSDAPREVLALPQYNWVPKNIQTSREEEKRLFQLLGQLPHWGIGRLFTRRTHPHHFWKVTRVAVDHESEGMDCGYAWGILTQKGYNEGYEKEMPFVNEHMWRLIPKHEEAKYVNFVPESKSTYEVPMYIPMPPLLAAMERDANPEKAKDGKEPMVRMLIKRDVKKRARQRHPDGTLV